MSTIRCEVNGSAYIGAFASCSELRLFVGSGVNRRVSWAITRALGVECIETQISGSDLVGIFCRSNSNGMVVSRFVYSDELSGIGKAAGINVEPLKSDLNAVGNNVLANDKIALVNPDYSREAVRQLEDVLGVEVVRMRIASFKTVGANNILTNKGMVINNRSGDEEKERVDSITGFDSVRSTANTGALAIGLATLANSKGAAAGNETTGYELARIMQALDLE